MSAPFWKKWLGGGSDDSRPVTQRSVRPPLRGYQQQRRSFEAAARDRLVNSWTAADQTVNQSLLKGLRTMRARSRDWFRNHEYGRKFAQLVQTNIVGHAGFTLKVECRENDKIDTGDSARVTAAYQRFAKRGAFDVTGRLSEAMFDRLLTLMVARDGEALVRFCIGESFGLHQFQVQLLPAHLLDEDHNRDLDNGHRIRMGVEFDAFMRRVAYHLRVATGRSDIDGQATRKYERIPAAEMLHVFVEEDADQWRGVPWAYASLRSARHLDQFEEAALVAANAGASKMGFFKQIDGAEGQPTSGSEAEDGSGDFINEATPGTFEVIPDGYELQEWDPNYPSDAYEPFTKANVRRIATGVLVSAHSLSGDLTDVNFSSIRSGTLDERESWKVLQGWLIKSVKEVIFEAWLTRALVFDPALKLLPYAKFDKFNAPVFQGRRWDWVDPKSDVQASREAVALGIKSRARIIRENGDVPEDVWRELDEEAARGFAAPAQPGAAAQPAPSQETKK